MQRKTTYINVKNTPHIVFFDRLSKKCLTIYAANMRYQNPDTPNNGEKNISRNNISPLPFEGFQRSKIKEFMVYLNFLFPSMDSV